MKLVMMLYVIIFLIGISVGFVLNSFSRHYIEKVDASHMRFGNSRFSDFINSTPGDNSGQEELRISNRKDFAAVIVFALCAVVLHVKFGMGLTFLSFILFFALLFAIFRIDLEAMIIPDAITLNGAMAGFALSLFNYDSSMDWQSSLAGMLIGAMVLYIPAFLYRLFKGQDGIGGGDIKLLAMIGSFTGAHGVLFTIFLASLAGYLFGAARTFFQRMSSEASIPFGPFISSAAIIYILLGKSVIDNYFLMAGDFLGY